MQKLVDSHCHLNLDPLYDDLDGVLTRARNVGVDRFLTICTSFDEIEKIIAIASNNSGIYYSVGVHPSYAQEHVGKYDISSFLLKYPGAVAIGEVGLDFYHNDAPAEIQIQCFERHIESSIAMDKPLIVHTRDAQELTIDVLKKYPNARGVIHCFTGDLGFARRVLDMGFYISFSGILTYKRNVELRAVAKFVPIDRVLVETDSPFLSPQSNRGKVCEPAFIAETAALLAREREMSIDDFYEIININFNNLFTI